MEYRNQEYPLSHAQRRIWYAEKKAAVLPLWNISVIYEFPRPVSFDIAEKAVQICIENNDGLRMHIVEHPGEVFQYVSQFKAAALDKMHFQNEEELECFCKEKEKKHMNPIDSDLYYFCIYRVHEKTGFFMILHHLICDAWTGWLISDQIWNNVRNLEKGLPLGGMFPSYVEFPVKENAYLTSPQSEKDRQYWLDHLQSLSLPLKLGNALKFGRGIGSRRLSRYLTEGETRAIHDFCTAFQVGPFPFLFSILFVLMSRWTNENDLVIGTPVHNRLTPAEKAMTGMLINTMPLRICLEEEQPFALLVKIIARKIRTHLRHQRYPFDLLLEDLRESCKYPTDWLQLVFSYDTFTFSLSNTWRPKDQEIFPFVLHITERESKDRLKFEFDYQTAIFTERDIARVFDFFRNILEKVIRHPDIRLDDIEIMHSDEKECLLHRFNRGEKPLDDFQSIPQIIEAHARSAPDHPAVEQDDRRITYRELNEQAERIAAYLQKQNCRPGSLVGCVFDRSIDLIVSMLGILKAGAAYVPVDPAYPESRIRHMLEDSGVTLALASRRYREMIHPDIRILDCDTDGSGTPAGDAGSRPADPHDLLYVIYTSGSTGVPKGVMIEHAGFFNLLKAYQEKFAISHADRMTLGASPGFDAMAFEVWPCLTAGASLFIIPERTKKDPHQLKQWIVENRITGSYQPTAIAEFLMQEEWPEETALRFLQTAGERLTRFPKFHLPFRFFNLYGPTEDTIWTTLSEITYNETDAGLPSIGMPILNHQVYILNKGLNLQPVGVIGELCISGIGLARGYINHPELTGEKFIENPFKRDSLLYKTGDLAFWDWDGTLHYAGRKDSQVQIRGFRVELGEIEQQLRRIPGIRDAAVITGSGPMKPERLVAFVSGDPSLSIETIRLKLIQVLPEYMIPHAVLMLESMPRNAHGKIDTRALALKTAITERTITPAVNPVERCLAACFEKFLDIDPVSMDDDFFELGGDSIKAIQISYEMQKYGYEMRVADLYEYHTIEKISRYIGRWVSSSAGDEDGKIPLTPIQHWFFNQKFTDTHIWNQILWLRSGRRLQPETVQLVFMNLAESHTALRSVFKEENGKWTRRISGKGRLFDYLFEDLRYDDVYIEHMEEQLYELQRMTTLENGPLVKLGHFRTSDGDFLVFIIHHLLIDGLSWRILIEDFMEIYSLELKNKEVPRIFSTSSFSRWASCLNEYASDPVCRKQSAYWQSMENSPMDILKKEHRVTTRTVQNECIKKLVVSEGDTRLLLRDVHHAYRTNTQDILLTCLCLSLHSWQGLRNIMIQLESHGRQELKAGLNISRSIGWFTALYPVLFSVLPEDPLSVQIKKIKETLRRIPDHGLGYGVLKYLTSPEEQVLKTSFHPEICFNYLGEMDATIENNPLDLTIADFRLATSLKSEKLVALEINSVVWNGRLEIWFGYHHMEFSEKTIFRLIDLYRNHLSEIIRHCLERTEPEWTPSDYGDSSLSLTDLMNINDFIDPIE